jgi:hypothetical protein
MQHCEVDGFANAHPRLAKIFKWKTMVRDLKPNVTLHASVLERFALPSVSQCGRDAPYRPPNLAKDERLKDYYGQESQGS